MKPDSTQSPVRIVLADDHDLVRSGIKALLSMIDGVDVIAEARDGEELIQLVESLQPDIVMTDISMPRMDGIAAISQIHARHPQVRMLVLSMYDTVDFVKRAVGSGACGYLMKDAPPFELEQAVRSVMATGSYFSPAIAQRLLQPSEPTIDDELTIRQIEILKLIAQGHASKEIAFELGLSPKTVDVHRARIMERLRLNDIASLTLYAVRKGLVKP
ncbi:MAG: response regulator transcription factor [Variovorax sp.]